MILKSPAVDLKFCNQIANLYINDYNDQIIDGKPRKSRDKLKLIHKTVFSNIIWRYLPYVNKRIEEGNYKLESTNLPRLELNNVALAKQLHVCSETVGRAKKRLLKAGMILKDIYRGSESDYILILNPLLLVIYDQYNADFKAKLYRTEIEHIKVSSATKCHPLSIHKKDTNNNLKTQNTVYKIKMCVPRLVKDTKKDTKNGNTPKQHKPIIPPTQNSIKKTSYEEKMHEGQSKIENMKRNVAKRMIALYISLVLGLKGLEKDTYPGNESIAEEWIINEFLVSNNAVNIRSLESNMDLAIRKAARYAKKIPEYQAYFPAQYFNPNNTKNGIRKALSWVKNDAEHKTKQDNKKKTDAENERKRRVKEEYLKMGYVPAPPKITQTQLTDNEKLIKAITAYNQNPGVENYGLVANYVYQHIPHMIGNFMSSIKTI